MAEFQVILRVKNARSSGDIASISTTPDVISIADASAATALRTEIKEFLFGPSGASVIAPVVEDHATYLAFGGMPNLDYVDKHTYTMEYGIESIGWHFHAVTPNGKLIIYHHGHFETLQGNTGYETIAWAIANDYDVMAFEMPLYGNNNQPEICPPGGDCFTLNHHNWFSLFSPTTGHSLRFFVEPVVAFLNYAIGYSDISMVGLSGGGWTTTLVAAFDTRIDRSFPVSGSMPLYTRIPADMGDWEQNLAAFYTDVANYSELYVLAAIGAGRKQMQILNINDSCCFASNGSTYTGDIIAAVTALSGDWSFWQETTIPNQHAISVAARAQILTEL